MKLLRMHNVMLVVVCAAGVVSTLAHALTAAGENCHAVAFSSTVPNASFDQCSGAWVGNNTGPESAAAQAIANGFGAGVLPYRGTSDTPVSLGYGPFQSNPTGLTTGTLLFDFPMYGPFVLGLKAAHNFSLFYYDGSPQPISSINFSTMGVAVNKQGGVQGLSHASLYGGVTAPIPEPETYALMLAGLAVVGFIARRRIRRP